MKHIFFFILLTFLSIDCWSQNDVVREIYSHKNSKNLKWANRKNPDKVTILRMTDYTDSIFPNDEIMKFKNIENLSIHARFLRKKKTDSLIEPLKIKIDTNKLYQLKKLKYLGFVCFDFSNVPIDLCYLENLKGFAMDMCLIDSLPVQISNLKNLEGLFLRINNLKYLPDEIQFLDSLKYLDLSNNMFTDYPVQVISIKNLKRLGLGNPEGNKDWEFGFNWPYRLSLNKIDYLNQFDQFKKALYKGNVERIYICVNDCNVQSEMINRINNKMLSKKIGWEKFNYNCNCK